MADILAFPTKRAPVDPAPTPFDRVAYRGAVETSIRFLLDQADGMIAILDRLDGDPDFEPDADGEEAGDSEPDLSALVFAISQTRWVGFDHGGAA